MNKKGRKSHDDARLTEPKIVYIYVDQMDYFKKHKDLNMSHIMRDLLDKYIKSKYYIMEVMRTKK